MLNIKNQVNYLTFFNFFVSIFLLLFFSFKNSLYSYLIFIIISNIIYYIFDKKNIFNFFFITVIITSILYIYLYNKKEGFKEGNNYNDTFDDDTINAACDEISKSSLAELESKYSDTTAVVTNKRDRARAKHIAADTGGSQVRGARRAIAAIGGRGSMGPMNRFAEMTDKMGKRAKKDVYILTDKNKAIQSIYSNAISVSSWADTHCKKSLGNLEKGVSGFYESGTNQVEEIGKATAKM